MIEAPVEVEDLAEAGTVMAPVEVELVFVEFLVGPASSLKF